MVAQLVNNPERRFSGFNDSTPPREVDVYYRPSTQDVVITVAGDKTTVITAYGASSPKLPDPVKADYAQRRWIDNPNFVEIVIERAGGTNVVFPQPGGRWDPANWPPPPSPPPPPPP
jgi:hypothetical protein